MAAILTALGGYFKSLWIRHQAIFIYITSILASVVVIFYKGKSAGRMEAETKQREANDEARARMDAVKPATADSVIDSLRRGDF